MVFDLKTILLENSAECANTVISNVFKDINLTHALIEIAKEEDHLEKFGRTLERLDLLFRESTDSLDALSNDLFDSTGRLMAMEAIAIKMGSHPILKNFLLLLVQKERIGFFPEIVREYRRYEDEIVGVVRVTVQTPGATAPLVLEKMLEKIEKILGDRLKKKVIAAGEIRPELIGGMVLKIDHRIYDGSVQRELERMRESII